MVMIPKVEFLFDFGSPNAYLADKVIPGIEKRTGAKFEYVPILLGGVFKLTNNRSPAGPCQGIKNKPELHGSWKPSASSESTASPSYRFNPYFPVNTLHDHARRRRGADARASSSSMSRRCSTTCGKSRRRWTIPRCSAML